MNRREALKAVVVAVVAPVARLLPQPKHKWLPTMAAIDNRHEFLMRGSLEVVYGTRDGQIRVIEYRLDGKAIPQPVGEYMRKYRQEHWQKVLAEKNMALTTNASPRPPGYPLDHPKLSLTS